MIEIGAAMGFDARAMGRHTLAEAMILFQGWKRAHCPPEGPKPPTDEEFDAAVAAARKA